MYQKLMMHFKCIGLFVTTIVLIIVKTKFGLLKTLPSKQLNNDCFEMNYYLILASPFIY